MPVMIARLLMRLVASPRAGSATGFPSMRVQMTVRLEGAVGVATDGETVAVAEASFPMPWAAESYARSGPVRRVGLGSRARRRPLGQHWPTPTQPTPGLDRREEGCRLAQDAIHAAPVGMVFPTKKARGDTPGLSDRTDARAPHGLPRAPEIILPRPLRRHRDPRRHHPPRLARSPDHPRPPRASPFPVPTDPFPWPAGSAFSEASE
jgi:hypothetical protein